MTENIELYKEYHKEFSSVPFSILDKLNNTDAKDINILDSKPPFKTDGLAYRCKFSYKNNVYEFYFHREELPHPVLNPKFAHRNILYFGQFVLYYNHEHVFNTSYQRYKERDKTWEDGTIEWSEMKINILANIPKDRGGFDKESIYITNVSENISPLIWISGLMDCERYLISCQEKEKLIEENKEKESNDDSNKDEDALVLAKKLLDKLIK